MAIAEGQIVKIQDIVDNVKARVAAHISVADNGGTGSINSGGRTARTKISWSGKASDVNTPVNDHSTTFLACKPGCCTASDVYIYVTQCMYDMCRVYKQNYQYWSSAYTNTWNGGRLLTSKWYYGFSKTPQITLETVQDYAENNNKPVRGDLISAQKLLDWITEIANKCKTSRENSVSHGTINSCYSSCHSSCHGSSRGRR